MSLIDIPHPKTTTVTSSAAARPQAPAVASVEAVAETREHVAARYAFAVARLGIGFIFLWAFLDKLFGLDHSTPSDKAWIHGGSPTTGFLKGVQGPFADAFHSIAGAAWADWLFMAGLLGIGLALMLGVGMRIAAVTGTLLLVFMWAASLPLKTNPFVDDHLVYAAVIVGLALFHGGDTAGLGRLWAKLPFVKRFPVLQ